MHVFLPILPIVLFRVAYEFYSLLISVLIGVVASLVIFLYQYYVNNKISYLSLATISIMGLFCLVDAMSSRTDWVMIGASIVALVYSAVFFMAYINFNRELTELMKLSVADFPEFIQKKVFRNSAVFFFLLAVVNEFIWRTQLESVWVEFRTFIVLPSILLFGGIQVAYFAAMQATTRSKKTIDE